MTLDVREQAGGEFFLLSTDPPLVHFTTADLGNLADGRYDVPAFTSRLNMLGAVVLITPEHLAEWVPLTTASRESRFSLADQFSCSYVNWRSADIWTPRSRAISVESTSSMALKAGFYDEDGQTLPWLAARRETERRFGEAEFFARTARLSPRKPRPASDGFDNRRADKFQKANDQRQLDAHAATTRISVHKTSN